MFLPPPLSTLFPYTTLFRSFRVSGFQDRRIRPLCHPSAERNYGLLGSVVLRRPRRLAAYIARSARRTVSASDSSFRAVAAPTDICSGERPPTVAARPIAFRTRRR